MILSRVWYLLLAIAAVAGLALAMVSVRVIDDNADEAVRDSLRRDRFELEATLKLDARSRIDAIAPVAANGDVRTALREATGRRGDAAIDPAISARLTTRLTELNRQLEGMAGDLLIATDGSGIIVAQIGGAARTPGAGLGAFPLVRRALDGYVRDDVWIVNDEVFRMAARPVIDGGQAVGAIIHGKRIDSSFAQLLSTRLVGASIGFFMRERMFASAMADASVLPDAASPPRQDDMAAPLAEVLAMPALAQGERTDPVTMPTGGLAVYSLVVGSAAHAQVGYAIARPVPVIGSPLAIFSIPTSDDWTQFFSSSTGMGVVGAGVLAFLFGLLFVWIERDRPLAKFRDATQRLAKRDVDRLIPTEFGGPLRNAAANINETIEKIHETAATQPKRKAADLDEILGPVPDQASSPAFFGFAGGGSADDVPQAPPAAPEAVKAPAPPPPPAKAAPAPPKPPAPPGPPKAPPGPPAAPVAAPAAVAPVAPAASAAANVTPAPAAAGRPSPSLGSTLLGMPADAPGGGFGPVQAQSVQSQAVQAQAVKAALAGPNVPEDEEDDEDGATMVARVPQELLAKSAAALGESDAEQNAHFRDVFDQFLSTKKECGESVTGLTFDKFVVTLRKNRDQIVKRHDAAKVRFTVYVKDGKAALKATPIRD